jgi:hypothetical protein
MHERCSWSKAEIMLDLDGKNDGPPVYAFRVVRCRCCSTPWAGWSSGLSLHVTWTAPPNSPETWRDAISDKLERQRDW